MKKYMSQKIKLGVFVIVGTLILVFTLYFIGNKQQLFTRNIVVYSEFENVNGLQTGNNVRYSGIDVGNVSKIEMLEESKILVEMRIEEATGSFMKKNAIATIATDGLVGSMVVNILPGNDSIDAPRLNSGDTIVSYSRIAAADMLSTLNVTNENAALLTADLLKMTNKILEGKGTLGVLLTDSLMANDVRQTLVNLKNTSKETNRAILRLNEKLDKIDMENSLAGVLFNDTVSKNQLQEVITNLSGASEEISRVSLEIEKTMNTINQGEGAFNYLMTDKGLVKNLDSTILNIKESSVKLNENMEALRHNFLFRGYFRRLERQERKELKQE